jgi:hypothetical protein
MRRFSIKSDDRGAIMVVALFMIIFGTAILFYGVATTQSVLFREHLQDTADSAALSTAITYARLMNALVLINIVMGALVAILLTLKLVEGIAIVGIAIAVAAAFFTGGASLSIIPPLNALRSTMSSLYEEVKPTVFEVLEVLKDVSDAVVRVAPVAAQAVAVSEVHNSRDNVANAGGFAYSASTELPVEPDSYSKLCKHAGELVVLIARKPFEAIGVADVIGAALSPIPVFAEAMSEWFCGGGGSGAMPDLSQDVERGYPRPDNARACESEDIKGVERGKEAEVKSPICEQAESERIAAQPAPDGQCQTQCTVDGPYEVAVKNARLDCDPSGNPRPSQYKYQLQQLHVVYRWNGTEWKKGPPELVSSKVTESDRPPCGPHDVNPTIAEGYNKVVHPDDDPTKVQVVCSAERTPELPYPDPDWTDKQKAEFSPDPVDYEYYQVPQIFACKRKERSVPKVSKGSDTRNVDEDEKSPKKLKNDIYLGSETFQVRSAVFGELGSRQAAKLVRLGLWHRKDPDNPLERLKTFGGFSMAQAEYYYAGPGDPEDWMWNMSWRARLKRFDASEPDQKQKKKAKQSNDDKDPMETLGIGCALPISGVSATNCLKMLATVEVTKDIIAH